MTIQLMTKADLLEIEKQYPGIFTTPGIHVNYAGVPLSSSPELSYLMFCCNFPVPFVLAADNEHLVAVCPECGRVCVGHNDEGFEQEITIKISANSEIKNPT